MKKNIIVIAGGGTGGHIYPGIAIARAIQKINSKTEVHFVGTSSGLERKIIPKEGFPLHFIESGKLNFQGNTILKLKTLFKIPFGILQSFLLLWKLRPDFVIGVGGYASGPMVLAASLFGTQTAIWEPNAMPGMANRILSYVVDKCFVVFNEAKNILNHKNIIVTGMPIREEIEKASKNREESEVFHLLSFGGSQGSRVINNCLQEAILAGGPWIENLEVVHQTGSLDFKSIESKYTDSTKFVSVMEFIYDMPKYYQWADIIVCRGGASSLAEAAAFGIIPIIIPLPAADNHQQKNAESLVLKNAGRMILQSELTPDRLTKEIQELRRNKALREEMVRNIKSFYISDAAESIAKEILK